MVSIPLRMRRLRTLLDIRLGPGAAIISPTVKRIHLNFAKKINNGHMGPRKFWHLYLPRLKYHNPAIPMTVTQTTEQELPASLTIFFTPPSASPASTASAHPSTPTTSTSGDKAPSTVEGSHEERSKEIDMTHKHESKILEELMALVEGKEVRATREEEEELRVLEEQRERSGEDRVRTRAVVVAKRRQEEILRQARESLGGVAAV